MAEKKDLNFVDFEEVLNKFSKFTSVPRDDSPLTVIFLLQNTFPAYKKQINYNSNLMLINQIPTK